MDKTIRMTMIALVVGIIMAILCTSTAVSAETAPEVTLTFDPVGGSEVDSIQGNVGDTVSLPAAVKPGVVFVGWYDSHQEEPLVQEAGSDTVLTHDMELRAAWAVDLGEFWSYNVGVIFAGSQAETVTWDFGDGSDAVIQDISQLSQSIVHSYPAKGVYHIKQTAVNTIGISIEFYKVDVRGYPYVEFESNGGSNVDMIWQDAYDKVASKPEDPVRDGFTFGGWFVDESFDIPMNWDSGIIGPVKLHAYWIPDSDDTLIVSFDTDGAGMLPDMVAVYGESICLPTPQKDDMVFMGWFDGTSTYVSTYVVYADATLRAIWADAPVPITYVVSFDSDGGSTIDPISMYAGTLTLPIPVRDGFTFRGWDDGTSIRNGTIFVDDDLTLKAVWSQDSIVPDDDGGINWLTVILAIGSVASLILALVTKRRELFVPAAVFAVLAIIIGGLM